MKVEVLNEFPHDKISLVNLDDVIAYLNSDPDQKTVDQLYDFGKLLLDQIRGLRNSYDAKLTNCLGWGTATLAIMLAGFASWFNHGLATLFAQIGIAMAFLGVLASILGFKSLAGWKFPSEKDWFCYDYLSWPERLKRHHLITMLEAHQSYSGRSQKKGYALMAAEYLLALSAISLSVALLIRQLS